MFSLNSLAFLWSSGCWQFDLLFLYLFFLFFYCSGFWRTLTWPCSSTFSKTSSIIWKFMVHILLKPGLENFEHHFTSLRDECNCAVGFIAMCNVWDECNCAIGFTTCFIKLHPIASYPFKKFLLVIHICWVFLFWKSCS